MNIATPSVCLQRGPQQPSMLQTGPGVFALFHIDIKLDILCRRLGVVAIDGCVLWCSVGFRIEPRRKENHGGPYDELRIRQRGVRDGMGINERLS